MTVPLSEFRGEEPCWRPGKLKMFEDTHPHLFNIAGTKDSCGDNTLRVLSRARAPRLYGAQLDKNDRSKVPVHWSEFLLENHSIGELVLLDVSSSLPVA